MKVKIEDEKIQEIVVGFSCCFGYQHVAGCLHVIQCSHVSIGAWYLQMEPAKGAGFLAMYEAVGGKVSAA